MGVLDEWTWPPLVPRCGLFGGFLAGVLGAVAGLVLGLRANPPTAWFAMIEVAAPCAALGVLIGSTVGAVVWAQRRIFR